MKPSEIIAADAQKTGVDPNKALSFVGSAIQNKTGLLLQKNNSVLLLQAISNDSASVHLFTVDQPMTLVKSLKYFVDKINESDLRAVYGTTENPKFLDLLVNFGLKIQESDNPKYNWMALV